jgi:glutamine synthetase
MGFQNEKDHPEVAPSQFEINYGYGEVVAAADQIQLYKLLTRQIANNMGYTACFLPKPVVGVNGSGMHTNVSISKARPTCSGTRRAKEQLSKFGWDFLDRILTHALDLCLIFNPASTPIAASTRTSKRPTRSRPRPPIAAPWSACPSATHRSMRVEVRAVAPDANPYLSLYGIFKTGIDGTKAGSTTCAPAAATCPTTSRSHRGLQGSAWIAEILGADVQGRYADLKQAAANRSPRELGTFVKGSEVQYHHEVYNQSLWNNTEMAVPKGRGVH